LELAAEASHLQEELKKSSSPEEPPRPTSTNLLNQGREKLTQALEQGQISVFFTRWVYSNSGWILAANLYLVSDATSHLTETLKMVMT
jgi:hypothetical protein